MIKTLLTVEFQNAQDEWNRQQLSALHNALHEKRRYHDEEKLIAARSEETSSSASVLVSTGEEPPLAWQSALPTLPGVHVVR